MSVTPGGGPVIHSLPDWWRELLSTPADPALTTAGHQGELLVARVRFWTFVAVVCSPLITLAQAPDREENVIALAVTSGGLALAWVIMRALAQGHSLRNLGLFTTILDVSLVSLTQALYLFQGLASVAANSRTTFIAYFVAIGCTCLRWDPRLCLVSGGLAVGQYAGIALGAWLSWNPLSPDVLSHGEFSLGQQAGRIVLLVAFTLLCLAIIQQSRRLRFTSTHDPLTRLMNRAYFEERLVDELSRAGRHEIPLCVAVVDVDHFKAVNDAYGHAAGDAALRVVATVLRKALRRSDLLARWGGEEFAIAFPETRLAEAFGKLEQLRIDIASHAIVLSTGGDVRLTISGGLAASRLDGTTFKELMDAADMRLLEAKRAGRNRVKAAPPARGMSGDWRAVVEARGGQDVEHQG